MKLQFGKAKSHSLEYYLGEELGAVLELIAALVEQEAPEGAGLLGRVKVGCILRQPLAQLCVHRRVLRLIEGFFKDLWW